MKRRRGRRWIVAGSILTTALFAGCASPSRPAEWTPDAGREATSLLGATLEPPPLDAETRAQYEEELAEAASNYAAAPTDEDAIIWLGRRTAYLGRYREAIAIYSEGLRYYPDSYRLLRHRGHRWITVREFDRAVRDLYRASRLVGTVADRVEPDGRPNARNTPTSTTHTNIYYHLGLAHYLNGAFDDALPAYRKCLSFSRNDDMRTAAQYWTYLTLRHLGREDDAAALLDEVPTDADIIENHTYHRLLLLFRGDLEIDDIQPEPGDTIDDATAAYGIAAWYAFNGRDDDAERMLAQIVEMPSWPAFGYVAAESELARRRGAPTRAQVDRR